MFKKVNVPINGSTGGIFLSFFSWPQFGSLHTHTKTNKQTIKQTNTPTNKQQQRVYYLISEELDSIHKALQQRIVLTQIGCILRFFGKHNIKNVRLKSEKNKQKQNKTKPYWEVVSILGRLNITTFVCREKSFKPTNSRPTVILTFDSWFGSGPYTCRLYDIAKLNFSRALLKILWWFSFL